MTGSRSRIAVLVTALSVCLALLAVLGAPADAAARSHGSRATARAAAPVEQRQHVVVNWSGSSKKAKTADAVIPGIGDLQLVCKPNDTMIQLYTPDRGYETQMWMQKYEVKNKTNVVSVKTARIYRYANASDPGDGGTGYYAHEGLNQQPGVENFEQGYMNGIISQRSSRSPKGPQIGAAGTKPVTTFELTWYWNGFNQKQAKYRSCKIDAKVTTRLDTRMSLTWHGDDNAPGHENDSWAIPGIGSLAVSCPQPTHDGPETPTFTVTPNVAKNAKLYVETVTGEGNVVNQVDKQSYRPDDSSGSFPTVPIPTNGTIRMKISQNGNTHWVLLSSYAVLNNAKYPALDTCELAAGWYDATFD